MNIVLSGSVLDEAVALAILDARDRVLQPRRLFLLRALETVERWQFKEGHRVDWIRPDGGAMCCLRLRNDVFDDAAVARFWNALPNLDLQLGNGEWFGESTRIARLGFGYLPLEALSPALEHDCPRRRNDKWAACVSELGAEIHRTPKRRSARICC